jgi:DNA-binding MarR family transcriptional regulator
MTTPHPANPAFAEMKASIQRLFQLRHRLRVSLPENIETLKKRLFQHKHSNPMENVTDFDLFYSLGSIFTQEAKPLTMGELSRWLNVPLSTATRIVDWLVNNNYAQRLPDPTDRRVVRVALTDAGNATYGEIDNFFMERIACLMRGFTDDERIMFVRLLQKIITTLEQEV